MKTITMGKGGCYDCECFRGTITNQFTMSTVTICAEIPMRKTPHPRRGCKKSKPSILAILAEKKRSLRKWVQ